MSESLLSLPVIDIGALVSGEGNEMIVVGQIEQACVDFGFFYVSGHGVDPNLQDNLEELSQRFFALDQAVKMKIEMSAGGRAWRGFFPVGDELTSGRPDVKEGIYFGQELDQNHPEVRAGRPMFGHNLFPEEIPEMKEVVLQYMDQMTVLGHAILKGISLSLGLEGDYFRSRYTNDPLVLFRIFHYPPLINKPDEDEIWGVGEHTDYGVLTILKQDSVGGLQVKTNSGWVEAPYLPNTFICNIGDMLDKMTMGYYQSTPHRVKNRTDQSRYSFPFFFDPNFHARIEPIQRIHQKKKVEGKLQRWDHTDLGAFKGTYGEYILSKVSKVFPQLTHKIDDSINRLKG